MPRSLAFPFGGAIRRGGTRVVLGGWLFALGCLSSLGVAPASMAEPTQPSVEVERAVSDILRTAPNRMALTNLLGVDVDRCLETGEGTIHCAWHLRNKHAGWSELARVLATRKRVAVVCELPEDGSDRELDSCAARPQSSNRSMFNTSKGKAGPGSRKGGPRGPRDPNASREAYASIARQWLDGARTVAELTRLMGALPTSCEAGLGMPGKQVCVWKLTRRTYGHGTVAASEKATLSKKMILRCTLPIDASPREAGSCLARIGS